MFAVQSLIVNHIQYTPKGFEIKTHNLAEVRNFHKIGIDINIILML